VNWQSVTLGAGLNTDTYTTQTLTLGMNKYRYRAIVTFTDIDSLTVIETSTVVTLTVNPAITITSDTSTITRKYGDAQSVRTIVYSGGTTNTGAVGTSTSHTLLGQVGNLASGRIVLDTSTSTVVFRVDTRTAVGSYVETITVTDFKGATASYAQRVVVNPADTLTVQADTLTAMTYSPSGLVISPTTTLTGLVSGDTRDSITFSYSSKNVTCANGGACAVGDIGPAGGVVFYVSNSGSINSAANISEGGTYLEAAPSPFSATTYNWCEGPSNPYTTLLGASGTAIGTGAANTATALTSCTGGAIYQAANLTSGGYSDWFLPSSNELSQMYTWRNSIGLSSNVLYWGSTEGTNSVAASLVMSNGGIGGQSKGQATPYWPIRAFSQVLPTLQSYGPTTTPPTNAGTYTVIPSNLTLTSGISTSNYTFINYLLSDFTINKARQDTLTITSRLAPFNGGSSTIKLITSGGTDTGTVTYSIATGGTASGCSVTTDVLTVTSAGTCNLVATKAATLNYLITFSDTVTVTFSQFVSSQQRETQLVPTQLPINGENSLETTTVTVPVVTSVTSTGAGSYTIVGTGFTGAISVLIGGTPVTIASSNSTTINITGAAGLAGPLFIECSDGRMGPVPFWLIL
jgi:hypothetical protein